MAKTKVSLGSNTGIEIQTQGDSGIWVTIHQGSKFVQTAASRLELADLAAAIDQLLLDTRKTSKQQ